jgi:hypothetical protein
MASVRRGAEAVIPIASDHGDETGSYKLPTQSEWFLALQKDRTE